MVRIPRNLGIFKEDVKHSIGIGVRDQLITKLNDSQALHRPLLDKLEEAREDRKDAFRV